MVASYRQKLKETSLDFKFVELSSRCTLVDCYSIWVGPIITSPQTIGATTNMNIVVQKYINSCDIKHIVVEFYKADDKWFFAA